MKVLSVDPASGISRGASKTGYAYFDDGQLVTSAELTFEEVTDFGIRRELLAFADVLVIEGQALWHGPNVKVMRQQGDSKCLWTVLAKDFHLIYPDQRKTPIQVIEMAPQVWMKAVNRGWKFGKGSKRNDDAIRQYVKARWGISDAGPDELAAICIGGVFLDQWKLENASDKNK